MRRLFVFFLFLVCALSAAETQPYQPPAPPEPAPTPWLTGPLIAPQGTAVPYGDFLIQSYVYFTTNTGTYNSDWHAVSAQHNLFSFNPQFLCFFGLTPWMDINVVPQFFCNTIDGQTSGNIGDFPVALDFQAYGANAHPYFPGIKFAVKETFPTGKFQNLNPTKLLADQTGAGTFGTTFSMVLYKVYHLRDHFFMSTTYSFAYTVNSLVHVHGFNTYGGGFGTNGKVRPGNVFQAIVSFEWSVSQNWAFALDNVYQHTGETEFSGTLGTSLAGTPATVGGASSDQFSFAPAFEYNFSSQFGIITGCWFTAAGRNSPRFANAVMNIQYSY